MPERNLGEGSLGVAPPKTRILQMNVVEAFGWKLSELGECCNERVKLFGAVKANIDAEKGWRAEEL